MQRIKNLSKRKFNLCDLHRARFKYYTIEKIHSGNFYSESLSINDRILNAVSNEEQNYNHILSTYKKRPIVEILKAHADENIAWNEISDGIYSYDNFKIDTKSKYCNVLTHEIQVGIAYLVENYISDNYEDLFEYVVLVLQSKNEGVNASKPFRKKNLLIK